MLQPGPEREPFILIAEPEGLPELEAMLQASSLAWFRVGDPRLPDPRAARVVLGSAAGIRPWLRPAGGPAGLVVGEGSAPPGWAPGVEYWLRDPVDAPALRLLLSHLLAPARSERRLAPRIDLQLAVRVRTGFRSRPAVLTELSATGARIETGGPLRPGARVEVGLPAGESGAKPCWIVARVLRTVQHAEARAALAFTQLPLPAQERIRSLVRDAQTSRPGRDPSAGSAPATEPAGSDERRSAARRSYARRVIARGTRKPRVLLGCDLSMEGMRVARDPQLEVGNELQIALHCRPGEVPLILCARVDRDDGERGLFLRFQGVGDEERKFLAAMVSDLPALESQDGSLVVSQVL